jgi:hypothetical protein
MSMQSRTSIRFRRLQALLILGLVPAILQACCPSGAWLDNFGSLYSIVTISPTEPDQPFLTSGVADTIGLGCGLWTIRPPAAGEPGVDPENPVAWVAENRRPNPADQCCYAFRFDGQVTGSGCSLIVGEYRNVGGKCEGSGQMFLQIAQ